MNKNGPIIVIEDDMDDQELLVEIFKELDYLTLDGSVGEIFPGSLPVIDPILAGEFAILMDWARKTKKLIGRVRSRKQCLKMILEEKIK
jgi:hypothetical protein